MARFVSRFTSCVAMAAALSMAATPAFAAPLPHSERQMPLVGQAAPTWSADAETTHRSWRGRGGWHRDRGGVDAGDVLAGGLILGGIAGVASAASKSQEEPEYRDDYPHPGSPPDSRYDYSQPQRGYSAGGIDNAVNMCVDQVERGSDRVASVDNASRTASGWQISGQLSAGGNFSCAIDNDGRIRNVDVGGSYRGTSYDGGYDSDYAGGQWNDDAYARARAAQNGYPQP